MSAIMLSVRDAVVVERLLRLVLQNDKFIHGAVEKFYWRAGKDARLKIEAQVRTALQKRGKL